MSDLLKASKLLDSFRSGSLRTTVARIERQLRGVDSANASTHLQQLGVGAELMLAALLIKKNSSQINEIVHTVGILLVLPLILQPDEVIESLSLAAGNTGKGFDLETNRRIAEFTFISWQGGPEVIRQNKIFKDFYFLAEADTKKDRELYVAGLTHPQKFFESGRRLPAILRGNNKLGSSFQTKYGDTLKTVRDYFQLRGHLVLLC
jgi:hypothetical protein